MKKRFGKLFCCLLALMMLLCSCGSKKNEADVNLSKESLETDSKESLETDSKEFEDYPLETDSKLTYWVELAGNVSATASNLGDTAFAKELEKQTGVKVDYLHPASGQASEAFSLMLASREFPDIIEYNWSSVSGGPSGAINDEVIVDLTPYLEEYAPNLTAFLKENPEIDKAIKTADGKYYCFPLIKSDKSLLMTAGPIVRADWLNDLGIDTPVSVEEWEDMLTKFKEIKGATAPLTKGKA